MARRIPLAKIGDYSREKYEKLLRYVVFETDKQLKEGSPVDTGRLRLSWSISENDAPGYDPWPAICYFRYYTTTKIKLWH
jgi:hypothetical protein